MSLHYCDRCGKVIPYADLISFSVRKTGVYVQQLALCELCAKLLEKYALDFDTFRQQKMADGSVRIE